MYGIPNMKLEKQVIDRRLNIMKAEGIDFVTCADVGGSTPARMCWMHTMPLCWPAVPSRRVTSTPGRDAQGIYFAVDYLTSVTRSLLDSGFSDGKAVSAKDKKVLVIGGGDTGNDCVGTAIRQGCASVTQLEMMPCPPTERHRRQRLARMAQGAENRLRPAGSHCRVWQRPAHLPDHGQRVL